MNLVIHRSFKPGQIITARKLRDENSMLKRKDMKPLKHGMPFLQLQADSSGYYQCCTSNTKLYVSCIIPGNNQGS